MVLSEILDRIDVEITIRSRSSGKYLEVPGKPRSHSAPREYQLNDRPRRHNRDVQNRRRRPLSENLTDYVGRSEEGSRRGRSWVVDDERDRPYAYERDTEHVIDQSLVTRTRGRSSRPRSVADATMVEEGLESRQRFRDRARKSHEQMIVDWAPAKDTNVDPPLDDDVNPSTTPSHLRITECQSEGDVGLRDPPPYHDETSENQEFQLVHEVGANQNDGGVPEVNLEEDSSNMPAINTVPRSISQPPHGIIRPQGQLGSRRVAYGEHYHSVGKSGGIPSANFNGRLKPPLEQANSVGTLIDVATSIQQHQSSSASTLSRSKSVGHSASQYAQRTLALNTLSQLEEHRETLTRPMDGAISARDQNLPPMQSSRSIARSKVQTQCPSLFVTPSAAEESTQVDTSDESTEMVSEHGSSAGRTRSTSPSLSASPTTTAGTSTLTSKERSPHSYHYRPLMNGQFRLVKVSPGRSSDLRCQMIYGMFENDPEYTAISYAWGDGIDTKTLLLDGIPVTVGISLYEALEAVRHTTEVILVWVDALCINQTDKDECNTQVGRMRDIYTRAVSVAVWLGPEADESGLAIRLLENISETGVASERIRNIHDYRDSAALLVLFKRGYWKRLWVVQEVLLARSTMVYCGNSKLPWETYSCAADAFWDGDSDPHTRQGPSSFPKRDDEVGVGPESLLEIMRSCRMKLSENPRDKIFGILGLLSEDTRSYFTIDYTLPVKSVYTSIVAYLIKSTGRIDVICESIHYPLHVNPTGLPSWCPDWSHYATVSGLGRTLGFDASRRSSGPTTVADRNTFDDERRRKELTISAVHLDIISATGLAVGTFCASQDYLPAFMHWRALLLHQIDMKGGDVNHPLHDAFCRTLCLGQIPNDQGQQYSWRDRCYHVFSSLLREKLPYFTLDEELRSYATATGIIEPDARRKFLQDNFGNHMTGRSFCITRQGLVGMGSGFMTAGDVIVVPFGCSTPILLRKEDRSDKYSFVGDVYVDGYMDGEAIAEMDVKDPRRPVSTYTLV